MLGKLNKQAAAMYAFLMAYFGAVVNYVQSWDVWQDFDRSNPAGAVAAQTQTIIQGVVIVVVGMVGVTIVSQISGSFGTPENTGLSEAQNGLIQGFGSMVGLIQPLLVVLVAVVIIAVVQRIRQ